MKSEAIGGVLYISFFFGIILLFVMMTGCTTVNYHMDGNLFYRCKKSVLDTNYNCEAVSERELEEGI